MAPVSLVDYKELIDKFKDSVKALSLVAGPIHSNEDLLAILSKSEPPHIIARLRHTLMKDNFKSLLTKPDTEGSIPRKRQRIDPVPEVTKPPQLSKNFVRKPPPPLEALVDSNQKRNEAIETLNPPQPAMTAGLLQTIQLAQFANILTTPEAMSIFKSVASNL